MKSPVVTVGVCTFNGGRELIAALQALLAQTLHEIEIIVVDDGSTDESVQSARTKVKDSRIAWLLQSNAGKAVAMNRVLEHARGEFIAIQDADDLCSPQRLEIQTAALRGEPELGAVFCGHELLIGERRLAPLARPKDRQECRQDIDAFRMPGHDPTIVFRREYGRRLRFDPELRIGQGYDFILRLGEVAPMRALGECLYSYRITANSVTHRDPRFREWYVSRVLRKACNRRGLDYDKLFPPPRMRNCNRDWDNNLAAHFMDSVCSLRRAGRKLDALRTAMCCSALHPFDPHYHKALMFAVTPMKWVEMIRKHGRA